MGGKHWTFIAFWGFCSFYFASQSLVIFQSGLGLLSVRMCQLLWRQRERTLIPSLADGLIDIVRLCKNCNTTTTTTRLMWRRSSEDRTDKERTRRQRLKKKKKKKENGQDDPNKNLSDEKWRSNEEKLHENLAGRIAEKPQQRKHKQTGAWKQFEGGRRSSASDMHSVLFLMDKLGYTSEWPRGKTASLCLAPVRSPEQDRHVSLPSRIDTSPFLRCCRSSGWRRW